MRAKLWRMIWKKRVQKELLKTKKARILFYKQFQILNMHDKKNI